MRTDANPALWCPGCVPQLPEQLEVQEAVTPEPQPMQEPQASPEPEADYGE